MIKIEEAHERSWKNASEIEDTTTCSCYYCCSTFKGSDIDEYVDNDETALCPVCGIDSVIPEEVNKEKLEEINKYNFSGD